MHSSPLSSSTLSPRQTNLLNLSVEEENLGSIPFAVLEQRVGKRLGKIEITGSKTLPDGTDVTVTWQVQGNPELGLPTEYDLDVFMAIGVLTFRNNFAKTVTFQGREIARILNISTVHGKIYERMKLAMDRFIPLRFRALTQSDRHEDVKWVNVFQEASFSFDRKTGRCIGTVTWTDKIINAMDNGFFRVLDATRYMQLDGLTAKHLYRYLAVAFEQTEMLLIDARQVAVQHLGILNPPKYLSRLMQTLEPALEQLRLAGVVASWHVVSKADWRIAIRRAESYVPERQTLSVQANLGDLESRRLQCAQMLERGGYTPEDAASYAERASEHADFYIIERAAHLAAAMINEQVFAQVALQLVRQALDNCPDNNDAAREALDWIEIGLIICEQQRKTGRRLRNGAGLVVKLARDAEARTRLVSQQQITAWQDTFRKREAAALRQHANYEERLLLLEYERYRDADARRLLAAMTDEVRQAQLACKMAQMRSQERFHRLTTDEQKAEAETALLSDIARQNVPLFEKWRLRRIAGQAILPFFQPLDTPVAI